MLAALLTGLLWAAPPAQGSTSDPSPYAVPREFMDVSRPVGTRDIWAFHQTSDPYELKIAHYLAGQHRWQIDTLGPSLHAFAIASPDQGWAIADGADPTTLWEWDGGSWTASSPPFDDIKTMSTSRPDDLWVIDLNSRLWQLHGSTWTEHDLRAGDHYYLDVFARSPTDVWRVGQTGNDYDPETGTYNWIPYSLHWDGQQWTEVSGPALGPAEHGTISNVTASRGSVFGVLEHPTTAKTDLIKVVGDHWVKLAPVDAQLDFIDASAGGAVYATYFGKVLRFYQGRWRSLTPADLCDIGKPNINRVEAYANNEFYAVGYCGGPHTLALHYKAGQWTRI